MNSNNPFINSVNSHVPDGLELFGEEGCKYIRQLQHIIIEFNKNGQLLSNTVSKLPSILEDKLYQARNKLTQAESDRIRDLFQKCSDSLSILSAEDNPFPPITLLTENKKQWDIYNLVYSLTVINNYIVSPMYNQSFKLRSFQCVLHTFSYEKLISTLIDLKDIQADLITPFQRLTRLSLMVDRLFEVLTSLRECITAKKSTIPNEHIHAIDNAWLNMYALSCKAKCISLAVNEIERVMHFVKKYNLSYKNNKGFYADDDTFKHNFVEKLVNLILEERLENENSFKENVLRLIKHEYASFYIAACDELYHDLAETLGKIEKTNKQDQINKLLAGLKKYQDDSKLSDLEKLSSMKILVQETYENAVKGQQSFFARQSNYFDTLKKFVDEELDNYKFEIDDREELLEPVTFKPNGGKKPNGV